MDLVLPQLQVADAAPVVLLCGVWQKGEGAAPLVPWVVPLVPCVVPLMPCVIPLVPCVAPLLPCVVPLVPQLQVADAAPLVLQYGVWRKSEGENSRC